MQSLLHSVKYSYSIITCICIFSLTGIGERERRKGGKGRRSNHITLEKFFDQDATVDRGWSSIDI